MTYSSYDIGSHKTRLVPFMFRMLYLTASFVLSPASSTPEFSANQTIDLSAHSSPPSASLGQYFWVGFNLTVPPGVHASEVRASEEVNGGWRLRLSGEG